MTLHLLLLENYPIYDQLKLEEALLRTDERSFCLVNFGSPPAIVMGISGQADKLVDFTQTIEVPIIRRFSGGGCVVVDEETLFVTFLFNRAHLDIDPFPETLLRWTEKFYRPVFDPLSFSLQAQDYTLGARKCGGNAQYFRKQRFLHHSTFLWDWQKERMDLLLVPQKTPGYRQGRSHESFLTPLKAHFACKEEWLKRFLRRLEELFALEKTKLADLLPLLEKPHRATTSYVEKRALLEGLRPRRCQPKTQ